MRDLDVKAMHLVVLDPQVGDAGAFALARFEVDQELAGVFRQSAQFVEFGIEAARDHAAVAHQRGRLRGDRTFEQRQADVRRRQFGMGLFKQRGLSEGIYGRQRVSQCRQLLQAGAQRGQVARARRQQRDAAGDALDVGHAGQQRRQRGAGLCVEQRANGCVARLCDCLRARRMVQPVAQQPRAHRGAAVVEQREQGG